MEKMSLEARAAGAAHNVFTCFASPPCEVCRRMIAALKEQAELTEHDLIAKLNQSNRRKPKGKKK